ncbi:hypothetical protein [Streptomyces sp. NPDC058867]|uniref:hypothetical protein n=1 Tax=unclassified Streptomyces TaxID=2593676 RepID=UPI0036A13D0F
MNREPAGDRRQLLDTLQGLLDALPRPDGGHPPRAEDVLSYLRTGRAGTGGESGGPDGPAGHGLLGEAAVEASLRLVIEAFTALSNARGNPDGPR